eukprot:CAMPEP_0206059162 /NCGR_PEP_ID=MMETSP1466-20131121/48307_1 /ASSEMBLY_ACC=CAM_ASM_001126 /TAXON_ID=44452 /ORGANISM="Pavlova gyrans, Strain CCMP608" /LENGTH=211 /DNA_ID=CAMNT_0053434475 /DNA_START=367 /DNA_END=1004 /DNA_ORIENTATION=+
MNHLRSRWIKEARHPAACHTRQLQIQSPGSSFPRAPSARAQRTCSRGEHCARPHQLQGCTDSYPCVCQNISSFVHLWPRALIPRGPFVLDDIQGAGDVCVCDSEGRDSALSGKRALRDHTSTYQEHEGVDTAPKATMVRLDTRVAAANVYDPAGSKPALPTVPEATTSLPQKATPPPESKPGSQSALFFRIHQSVTSPGGRSKSTVNWALG